MGVSLVAQLVKNLPVMQETQVQFLGREDPLEKQMATPLHYSFLENPMDGGAWQAPVHGITKSRTWLSDFTFISGYNGSSVEMMYTPFIWSKAEDSEVLNDGWSPSSRKPNSLNDCG